MNEKQTQRNNSAEWMKHFIILSWLRTDYKKALQTLYLCPCLNVDKICPMVQSEIHHSQT